MEPKSGNMIKFAPEIFCILNTSFLSNPFFHFYYFLEVLVVKGDLYTKQLF